MKKLIALLTLAALAACPLAGFGQASIQNDPAYLPIDKVLDLQAIPPQVNVNLPQFLLKDAISGLKDANAGTDVSELTDLVKDVKLIRVVVLEANDTNRAAIKKAIKTLKTGLDAKWTSIVTVEDGSDNVGIYVMGDPSGTTVAGVTVLVFDGHDTVIANVVGNVSIGKLMKLAAQSNKLPKNLLMGLQGVSAGSGGGVGSDEGAQEHHTQKKKQTVHDEDHDSDSATNAADKPAATPDHEVKESADK